MIQAIITLIIYLLVLGALYWLVTYVLANVTLPEPMARLIHVAVVVIFVLIAIVLLLNLVGVGTGIDLPRIGGG